ncbi:MAG: hypothetical protein IV094_03720 [Vitreoscilla sp.]|nr:hypothetical protein [Vitreoscilla sp.]
MAAIELDQVLPIPGPVWGRYPMRDADDRAPPWRRPQWGTALFQCRQVARQAASAAEVWKGLEASDRINALGMLRQRLRRSGLGLTNAAQALGAASAYAEETLGWSPRPTQLVAAAALLSNRMAEMATGEGKTLATGLAAAVAALTGMPVHVVTANDYLAARDAARLTPLFGALGLSVAALPPVGTEPSDGAARRAVYAHDIVYATAKELAFDFLRDRQAGAACAGPEPAAAALAGQSVPVPLMRGLCMALLDEADSILLDEAEVPLILSRAVPNVARRAFLWQALALARGLAEGLEFTLHPADRRATLTAAGEERLATQAACLGGPWQRRRYRREAVLVALAALHLYRRNEHYVLRDGAIELLDEITGRIAAGRVWSRGLHTLVALKEGLRAPAETETVSQTTFQRFFQRYWRLCGLSGTLWEARAELHAVYGATVVRVPLHRPCRRVEWPPRQFESEQAMFDAVARRVAALRACGRPVLVGTDSVADSERLSACLQAQRIDHAVLNALHHAAEAGIVAGAGRSGQVTVATRMAGRGTDIELDAAAHAAGGLHVLSCQNNPSQRLDRQLAGRAGRHGDPGSHEEWFLPRISASSVSRTSDSLSPWISLTALRARLSGACLRRRWTQRREERRRAALRHRLLEQDLQWERRLAFAGRDA